MVLFVAVPQQHTELFHENQIDGTDDKEEGQNVVPVQVGALEQDGGNDGKDSQRDTLLDDLQLNQIEGSSVVDESHAVGRYLTTVLKEGYHPREGYDAYQRPVTRNP